MSASRRMALAAALAFVVAPRGAAGQKTTETEPMLRVEVQDSLGLPLPDAKVEVFTSIEGSRFWECAEVAFAASASVQSIHAQPVAAAPLMQLEVGDSIGLPLPNARVELFTRVQGAKFREWLWIDAATLPEGIHLLRFSHSGYRPAVFSVPLSRRRVVSLRLRLRPDRGDAGRRDAIEGTDVPAIGLGIDGRRTIDIIGDRRVLDRAVIDRADAASTPELLRIARNTGLKVEASVGGGYDVWSEMHGTRSCGVAVMINGDPTLMLSFYQFAQLYRLDEAETIEIISKANAIGAYFRRAQNTCAVVAVWLTGRAL